MHSFMDNGTPEEALIATNHSIQPENNASFLFQTLIELLTTHFWQEPFYII
jgi:hypothetical protein